MKKARIITILTVVTAATTVFSSRAQQNASETADNKSTAKQIYFTKLDSLQAANDSLISLLNEIEPKKNVVRDIAEIINDLDIPDFRPTIINKVFAPWVFSGYRNLTKKEFDATSIPVWFKGMEVMTTSPESLETDSLATLESFFESTDSIVQDPIAEEMVEIIAVPKEIDILAPDVTPKWLRDALTAYRIQEDFIYSTMIASPSTIEYSYWGLPVPPRLPDEDVSFASFIKKLDLPEVDTKKAKLVERTQNKIHWLHNVNGSMQFSQAYYSSNWYQGGNNNVSVNFNANWNVSLNTVYHPNYLFTSNLSYRLGFVSTPHDQVRDFNLSQDYFEHNMNFGIKAVKKWYYSITTKLTTQLFNNYNANSNVRKSSFMSPGDFRLGVGMTYNTNNKKNTFRLSLSIDPLAYNLKICIADNDVIPHSWFSISPDKHTKSYYGSNLNANVDWQIMWNIRYNTRFSLFTNYDYWTFDSQHSLNFDVNKFLTTSLFVNMRYDTSYDSKKSDWKKFMLKEILGFGLTYTFSTKK